MFRRTSVCAMVLAACAAAACATKDQAPADSMAMAGATTTGSMAMAPAMTAASLAGTWSGVVNPDNGDSAMRFTAMAASDGSGKFVPAGSKDTVPYMSTFDGDSTMFTSQPYTDSRMKKGSPQVMFKTVGRMSGDKLMGTSMVMLATKPDSVIARSHWEATRMP